jgi:(p)ppGpp synthase/HD superfamily hydrolase
MKTLSDFVNEFAKEAHEGQFRRDGKTPYFCHPSHVADLVRKYKKSSHIEELVSAAYLHDTLEDTKITYYDLVGSFGYCVASLVLEVTSNPDMKSAVGNKDHYLSYKLQHMTNWALVIKLCDRLDNVSDMKDCNLKWCKKYIKETIFILDYLFSHRELTETHKAIIKDIYLAIELQEKNLGLVIENES